MYQERIGNLHSAHMRQELLMRTDLLSQRHTAGLRWSQSWLIGKAVPHLHLFSNREHQVSPSILSSQQILYLTTQHHSQWNCDIILVVCILIPFRSCNSKTTSHLQFSILRPRCNINDTIYLINDIVLWKIKKTLVFTWKKRKIICFLAFFFCLFVCT